MAALTLIEEQSAEIRRLGQRLVNLPSEGASLEDIEFEAIIIALERCAGQQKNAAELLKISPRMLNYKMKTHKIERPRDGNAIHGSDEQI